MKDIIIATGLPNSTATRRVGYLVKNNLVIRKISKKDKRKTILKLTGNGRSSFSSFFDYIIQKFEEPLQIINEKEKEVLVRIFKTLLK
jgi:DNA-binding MarR family transcriptional regulator